MPTRVHRIEVRPTDEAGDVRARAVERGAANLGLARCRVRTAKVYLIEGDLNETALEAIETRLLVDPVVETAVRGAMPPDGDAQLIEVHPRPGVMDPAAQSVREAIGELFDLDVAVSTGMRYDVTSETGKHVQTLGRRLLANTVIHMIVDEPFCPEALPRGHARQFEIVHVPLRELDDDALARLSREGGLFLNLDEMHAIQAEYQRLGRDPTDIELETLAQTWSEHCIHKTFKSRILYRGPAQDVIDWTGRPGCTIHPDGTVEIDNLLKSTVAQATHDLAAQGADWLLSVFVDNAGIIAFDDDHAVCVKVETHNHPSAIEPYGGAATGVGGCIRDVIGAGLGARPIAGTDVFCVAPPDLTDVPPGCLHPRRVLTQIVAGVRDYANRMGIPTVNGAVWFDERYVGNPLVFCGCIGVMPREMVHGEAKDGDLIVAIGGRTGRDGIHGATFSSAALTDAHADEFSHAVQIGNAIEEKRLLDAILRARDADDGCLYSAITDCGAGGFSSAVGEMGEKLGAEVHLERAPLKYDGLTYTEIWISEAQERMILAVPEHNLDALRAICDEEHAELSVLGRFGTPDRDLILRYAEHEVGRLSMAFLHDGLPMPTREAHWTRPAAGGHSRSGAREQPLLKEALLELLGHPNIASKHWVIRQYDHEVQGNVAAKPLVGPLGRGPADASVIEPVPGSGRGLAVACGLGATGADPYQLALGAIDECVRNLVCVGADPARVALLDNFCWPSCDKPQNLGALVRAAAGCYDGAMAYRAPFISGKDSLNNQFTIQDGRTIEIPPTLLITGVAMVRAIDRLVTMDLKRAGNLLVLVGDPGSLRLTQSHYSAMFGAHKDDNAPRVDLDLAPRIAHLVAGLVRDGLVQAAHDVSDGGLACAAAEMLIGAASTHGTIGVRLDMPNDAALLFGEGPATYLLEIRPEDESRVISAADGLARVIGRTNTTGTLDVAGETVGIDELAMAWRGTLDW